MLRYLVELLVLPPTSAVALLLIGAVMRRFERGPGRAVQALAVLWLILASTPCFGGLLLHSLQRYEALPARGPLPAAQAIVVLSAGADCVGAEYGGPVVGPMTMQRLRYAAALKRRTGLPLLVSGGVPATGAPPLAAMMARAAEDELGVDVRWTEDRSADTFENARYSADQLSEAGVERILLVTSAWHMPRAAAAFARFDVEVVAAPTAFRGELVSSWRSFLPHWSGLRDTCLAMHEWGGRVAYALLR
jgi:uncharacterized SAM-binding protein YcdF (DUF218 family)